jgi:Na+-driven multidrug efflux pump
MESPNKSFKGWKFSKWFTGNWKTIKELIKVGLPLMVSLQLFDPSWTAFLTTVVGKFVIDCGEFFFKKVSI